jgi:D-alanyl-D-alanine endopeptidase (penicillin-binding protein 7)
MIDKRSLPKVLLLLAGFVFFSASSIHFLENPGSALLASEEHRYVLDFDHAFKKGPYLNLRAAIAVNYDNGQVVYAKNADKVRPIASLSKLVTAMVLLDNDIDLNTTATITRQDARRSSRSRLRVGYQATIEDLLYAALLNSDNRAARAIARTVAGSYGAFAKLMNAKVRRLGLRKTHFVEPTGLDKRNVSTAHEVALLLHYALDYPTLAKITSTRHHAVRILNRKRTQIQLANTNLIIYSRYHVLTGKTGYIRASDYCLGTIVENKLGQRLTVVVLGVPGDKRRFREARKLIDWCYRKLQAGQV